MDEDNDAEEEKKGLAETVVVPTGDEEGEN